MMPRSLLAAMVVAMGLVSSPQVVSAYTGNDLFKWCSEKAPTFEDGVYQFTDELWEILNNVAEFSKGSVR